MGVAYFVSRFPHVSETFIVREMDAVADAGVEIDLFSLFPPTGTVVHPAAERWLPALRRGRLGDGVAGLLWWLWRRPARVLSSLAAIVRGYWRRPALAARALVTFVVACGHARSLAGANVTHIHAHYATYPALAAWLCWRLTALPYSFTAHAHDLFVDQSMLARKVRDAGFVVAISEFNRRFLAVHGAGPGGTEVHVVHCGIDPDAYSFRPRSAPPEGPVDALCVASLQEYKGHEVLLTALATGVGLERLYLDLVGDGDLRPDLERLAARLGVASRVRFAGGLIEIEVRSRLDNSAALRAASPGRRRWPDGGPAGGLDGGAGLWDPDGSDAAVGRTRADRRRCDGPASRARRAGLACRPQRPALRSSGGSPARRSAGEPRLGGVRHPRLRRPDGGAVPCNPLARWLNRLPLAFELIRLPRPAISRPALANWYLS